MHHSPLLIHIIGQKAEVTSQCVSIESIVENSPDDRQMDEELILAQTNAEPHARPQVVKSREITDKSMPEAAPAEGQLRSAEDQDRPSQRELPWRSDERIYKSRFIRGAFYGSQLGVLALGLIFVAYHFLLFIPKTISDHSMLQATLATDYGMWFLAGCTVVGWLGMVVLLLLAGATFSSLFEIEQ